MTKQEVLARIKQIGLVPVLRAASEEQAMELAAENLRTLGIREVYPISSEHGLGIGELLDAISDTYMRGRQTQVAMQSALDRTEVQLRSALRVPRGATFADLARRLPDDLSAARIATEFRNGMLLIRINPEIVR